MHNEDSHDTHDAGPQEFRFFSFTGQWPATFRALRHRNFQLFWTGQLISLIGTWLQNTVQGWLVYQLAVQEFHTTNPSFYVGLISIAGSLPMLVLTLFAGVVADRNDRRRILVLTQACSGILALALAVLTGTGMIRLWQVGVLAGLLGIVNAFDMPTRQSFVKDMVGPKDLSNAIALNSSIFNGARILGPAIAGVLISIPAIGIAGAFYANAFSYIAVIAGLVAIRLTPNPVAPSNANIWAHMREGLTYVIHHQAIRLILLIMAIFSVFGFSYVVLLSVVAGSVLHTGARGYGLLLAFSGVGALVGTLILATLAGRIRKGAVLLFGGLLFSVGLILFSLSHAFLLSAILLMFVAGGLVVASASINSLIQEIVPDHLRGRVVSIWAFIFAGFTPIGSLYCGLLGHVATPLTPAAPLTPILLGGFVCLLTIIALSIRTPWLWKLE